MLKIGLAQFSVQPGNAEANTEKMKQYIERAKKNKCHLIIFPELAIPGYFIGDNWDQPDYMTECVRCGEEIRALSDNITVIYGNVAIEADKTNPDGRPRKYNAMFIAQRVSSFHRAALLIPSTSKPCSPITANLMTYATSHPLRKWLRNGMSSRKTSSLL